jgi:mannose-1-phosphate guanylyltransferase
MAGGVGSRFWPVSTTEFPKQFHDMLGAGETLIQKTFSRLAMVVPKENILVLTNERYNGIVLQQLPEIKQEQVLLEPAMRNTAPCILYASLKIKKMNSDALIVVAPSDHWIEDEAAFAEDLLKCFEYCTQNDALLTLGIEPTFPNVGYGYIEFDKSSSSVIKRVKQFTEKPDYATAKSFIESRNFLWNGGIFIWHVRSITAAYETFCPQMFALFMSGYDKFNTSQEASFIAENYGNAEDISVDYAVMENARNVFVLKAGFDWNDLGTWGSLHEKLPKDANNNAVVNATVILENASDNIIRTERQKLIVIDGLSDYIIVDRDDVLLIYPKNKEQEIKGIVARLADTKL